MDDIATANSNLKSFKDAIFAFLTQANDKWEWLDYHLMALLL